MAFEKKYPNRKDDRKPYRRSKRFSLACRNHGSCNRCKGDRLYAATKERLRAHCTELQVKD